jgi:calcineurin-like phosphoesterase family protein
MDYYTSDTHYFHRNINLYCARPFMGIDGWTEISQEERETAWPLISDEEKDAALNRMHETMIALWNDRVKLTDNVFHLGDFGFGPKEKLTEILAKLNGRKWLVKGNHDKSLGTMKSIGFEEVFVDGFHTDSETGLAIYLRHKPNLDFGTLPFFSEDDFHLCGHIHDLWARQGNIINVGVDQSWFTPLTLPELLNRPVENCWIGATQGDEGTEGHSPRENL